MANNINLDDEDFKKWIEAMEKTVTGMYARDRVDPDGAAPLAFLLRREPKILVARAVPFAHRSKEGFALHLRIRARELDAAASVIVAETWMSGNPMFVARASSDPARFEAAALMIETATESMTRVAVLDKKRKLSEWTDGGRGPRDRQKDMLFGEILPTGA